MLASDVMSMPVISVGPETPVLEIAALLGRHRISGVPVLEEGRLVGVVDEMDLLHRPEIGTEQTPPPSPWWERLFRVDPAASHYVKSHAGKARDVMTRELVSVAEDATLAQVASLLDSRRIRRVPVVRHGKVIGIITRANFVQTLATSTQGSRRQDRNTDDAIRTELLSELTRQSWWRSSWSAVAVTDGVVQFRGLIDHHDERRAARVAAENVPGVRRVEDLRQRYIDLPANL